MPLDEKDREEIKGLLKESITPLASQISEIGTLAKTTHEQFPGMSKKHAGDVKDEILRVLNEKLPGETKPKEKPKDEPDRVAELAENFKAALATRDEALETERKKNALTTALQGVKFLSPKGMKFAQEELLGGMVRDGDTWKFKATEKVAGADVELTKPLDEAVKGYLAQNEWLVEGEAKGGVKAGSNANGNGNSAAAGTWKNLTYEQIKSRGLQAVALQEDRQAFEQKREEWQAKQGR